MNYQETSLLNIKRWQNELGLLPVPLFSDQQPEQPYILLNGTVGNFCLDLSGNQTGLDTRNYAWSSNVGHYIALVGDHVEVQRWDQKRSAIERYSRKSVEEQLESFHAYLEKDPPRHDLSIVAHAIRVFRSLRAVLGSQIDGIDALRAFLYLLACATEQTDRGRLALNHWHLSQATAERAALVAESDWQLLQDELVSGRPIEQLVPQLGLVLRHAAGQLFQEAHYEAIFWTPRQLSLGVILPPPVGVTKPQQGVGLHFTPSALARTLVEESLTDLDLTRQTLTIFDPACGSGEFLREVIRQLQLRGYKGHTHVIGWDISEAACDMANFVLAWEQRDMKSLVTVDIRCVNSLDHAQLWPQQVDMVLMNPPFVAWQDMNAEQRDQVNTILTRRGLQGQRPDMSHAFLLEATACLNEGGILGTILPASFLDAVSSEALRKHISEQFHPRLVARLGNQLLFPGAIVDAALYVAYKGRDLGTIPVAFWADRQTSSSATGLRMLRRLRLANRLSAYPVIEDTFSIYLYPQLGQEARNWTPRPYQSWKLVQNLRHLPRVKDLFDVRQGVRTGNKSVFVLTKEDWLQLPDMEQQFFRPAVINKSIRFGVLHDQAYVFYPYGMFILDSEEDLRDRLPKYYQTYLLPAKGELLQRQRVSVDRWWELIWPRSWQMKPTPKIVSTAFGDAGSFAFDRAGEFVVVQGLAWIPKSSLGAHTQAQDIYLAYLALLNSSLFSELLASSSRQTAGGQWHLYNQFVDNIPIPNFFDKEFSHSVLSDLALIGAQISAGQAIDTSHQRILLDRIYGVAERL